MARNNDLLKYGITGTSRLISYLMRKYLLWRGAHTANQRLQGFGTGPAGLALCGCWCSVCPVVAWTFLQARQTTTLLWDRDSKTYTCHAWWGIWHFWVYTRMITIHGKHGKLELKRSLKKGSPTRRRSFSTLDLVATVYKICVTIVSSLICLAGTHL